MSKFIDVLTAQGKNQIEVVDSKGVKGNILFYNKRDAKGNLILTFKADSNDIVLSSSSNGNEFTQLERFVYSNVTEPTSSNISDLVQTLNSFLYT